MCINDILETSFNGIMVLDLIAHALMVVFYTIMYVQFTQVDIQMY